MRHQKSGRKLNRTSPHRKALFRNMVVSLFRHGRITTTTPKAKELRRLAERLITISKRGVSRGQELGPAATLAAKRHARKWINDREVLQKLFDDFPSRYAERNGGYTRVIKLNPRYGDNAPMAVIELMPDEPKGAAAEAPSGSEEPAAEAKPKRRRKKKAESSDE